MTVKWDYDATESLLRFGRKNSGPWDNGNVPDDGDTELVIYAPIYKAENTALRARVARLKSALRAIAGDETDYPCDVARRALEETSESTALRDAIEWWTECSEGFEPNGWGFLLGYDATDELTATCNVACAAVNQALEEIK